MCLMPESSETLVCGESVSCEWAHDCYVFTAEGRQVELPNLPGTILSILMDRPDIRHRTPDLIEQVYGDPDDCGLLDPRNNLKVNICIMRRLLREGGIDIDLRSGARQGYQFRGVTLIDSNHPSGSAS